MGTVEINRYGEVVLTLSQWGTVADRATAALTEGHPDGRLLTTREIAAVLKLLGGIAGWQEYFAVDGGSASEERLPIAMPERLPFTLEGVG